MKPLALVALALLVAPATDDRLSLALPAAITVCGGIASVWWNARSLARSQQLSREDALQSAKDAEALANRREAESVRREADKDAKHDLEMCELTCRRMEMERTDHLADIALYKALLAANRIAIPHDRRYP